MNKFIATFAMCGVAMCAFGQGFNIDFGIGGQPSEAFGAAAGQPGFWNAHVYGPLRDLSGVRRTVRVKQRFVNSGSAGWFNNPANTGDFERLLNDARHVGTFVQGGLYQITFEGLQSGDYRVYTYAVVPSGSISYAPVYVPQATANQVQVVTGPMPGNAFEYLVTHSIHDVTITAGSPIDLVFYRAPFAPGISVNGLQIVPVGADRTESRK